MSWLSSLFSGDKTATQASSSLLKTGSQATGQGLGDVGSAAAFWQNILSGGGTKALAPQISGIQQQGQQKLQTLDQFGNRSGGTAAEAATTADTTRASINDLIASLTGSAATNLGSIGSNLLSTGTGATTAGADISLQNKSLFANLLNSVGQGVGKGIGGLIKF
jgi:hypothetical protein